MERMERKAEIKRKTKETDIDLKLVLGGMEESRIDSGIPFFDHMLASMARHGRFRLELKCAGDITVDDHHSVEDAGICLGMALREALGSRAGIRRFGDSCVPMDDAMCMAAVDLSGRAYFLYRGPELKGTIGAYSEEMTLEFFRSLAAHAGINLHVNVPYGENRHHIHESVFKAAGIALSKAWTIDLALKDAIPSTKGTIT